MVVNTFFETRRVALFDLAQRVDHAFRSIGLDYGVAGGLAVYLYVEAVDADAGRLTKDIDVIMRRRDLPRLIEGIGVFGLHHETRDGREVLMQAGAPSARRVVHLLFTGERVRPRYPEAVPDLGEVRVMRGVRVIPLLHLVRMKLTSFRAKDEAHLKDLDEAGLITADIERALSPVLRERLHQVRARE